ncbi:class I SAM-dependent methyltransferase [Kaarinaea lacus]
MGWRIILIRLATTGMGKTMRREALFSRSGFYGFLLESNVLLHREATRDAIEAIRPVLARCDKRCPVAVLDLACGGWPVAISDVMAAYPEFTFDYTGVDINPDQVALAKGFPYPDNVIEIHLIEGNAWELGGLVLKPNYPLIFSGMNLHHGTPPEVAYLGLQIQQRLIPGGRFISHDVYRPDNTPYLPRPTVIDGEPTALINARHLSEAGLADQGKGREDENDQPGWRLDYLDRMYRTLIERGADPDGADSTTRHMRSRDYPISTRELRQLMEGLGFGVEIHRYEDSTEPLGPYVAMCVMSQPGTD